MSFDEQHIAMPKLSGAPAYARPPMVAVPIERPFDPDELPLEAERTDEERELVRTLQAQGHAPDEVHPGDDDQAGGGESGLRGRPFDLRAVAGRSLGR